MRKTIIVFFTQIKHTFLTKEPFNYYILNLGLSKGYCAYFISFSLMVPEGIILNVQHLRSPSYHKKGSRTLSSTLHQTVHFSTRTDPRSIDFKQPCVARWKHLSLYIVHIYQLFICHFFGLWNWIKSLWGLTLQHDFSFEINETDLWT